MSMLCNCARAESRESLLRIMALSALEAVKALQPLSVEKTRNLVFHLGVPPNVLDDIEGQYNGDTRKQKFVEKWLDIDTNASWRALVSELKQIDMNVLADSIQSMYLSTTTKPIPKKRTKLPTSAAVLATSRRDYSNSSSTRARSLYPNI